jgi:hypothetical protein
MLLFSKVKINVLNGEEERRRGVLLYRRKTSQNLFQSLQCDTTFVGCAPLSLNLFFSFTSQPVLFLCCQHFQMVSLKSRKRLAASVLKCGKKKIWLDPNETSEIEMANSRTLTF